MKKLPWLTNKPLAAVSLIVALAVAVAVQKIFYYAEAPREPKDCPPLPPSPVNTTKPTAITVTEFPALLPWVQHGGTINDASCLDRTAVNGIVQVHNIEDIRQALHFASDQGLKVSVAGVKHSMGGQAFAPGALVLDMTQFNQMSLDRERKVLTVQSGATWHDIQNYLHPTFAVKAMQSTDIFTVGGSISVNAHGMDHQVGAVSRTIRSLRVAMADGSVKTLSRTQHPELFSLVVGGYGLFGVIIDAELDVTENVVYETGREVLNYKDFAGLFAQTLAPNPKIGLLYGHLSTAPQSFLKELILYRYEEVDTPDATIAPLAEVGSVKLRRFVINFSKRGTLARRIKWFAEKYLEPRIEACTVSRNQAMGQAEACLVSRNEPMHDSVPYLRNTLKNDTDILHEYFIPRDQFVPFVDQLREILTTNNANLLNASVRVVHQEDIALNYAPTDMFSIVLYINQSTDATGNAQQQKITQELIDATTAVGGRFFLPYQLHYTNEQLRASYPEIDTVFEAKQTHDPHGLFTNTWYEKYKHAPEAT